MNRRPRPGRYSNEDFSRDVIACFTQLREDLEDDRNLPHNQIGTLANATRAAIAARDTSLPMRVCAFLGQALTGAGPGSDLENAVAINFIEPLELRKTAAGRFVLHSMPEGLRHILLEREERIGEW